MGVSQEDIISGAVEPDAPALARFEAALARRSAREPFAYIVGRREFFSRDFAVGPGALIPRPESEMLVEEALRRFPAATRNCAFLTSAPAPAACFLPSSQNVPKQGARHRHIRGGARLGAAQCRTSLGLPAERGFSRGDWGESLAARFDVVFVNPPYVKTGDIVTLAPEIAVHEPASALDGGPDGLDAYRRFAPRLAELLSAKGRAFVEIGEGQAEAVSSIFEKAELVVDGTVTDLARIYRCLVMVAAEQQSRAKQKKQL